MKTKTIILLLGIIGLMAVGFGTTEAGANPRIATPTIPEKHVLMVSNGNDAGPGSLRQALADAKDYTVIAIEIPGETKAHAITLTSGELVIDKDVIIRNFSDRLITVERASDAPPFGIFHVTPDHVVSIEGLAIRNG